MSILIRGMDMPEENERIRIEICGDGRVLWTHQCPNCGTEMEVEG